jgi:hypothetical protein
MPRPYTYTRSRRLLMQAVLIAVLGGTLGLAAWVRHGRVGASGVALVIPVGLPRDAPAITGALPDWNPVSGMKPFPFPHWYVQAEEPIDPQSGPLARTLTISLEPSLTGAKAARHLIARHAVDASAPFQPLKFAGTRGVIVQPATSSSSENYKDQKVWHAYACAILTDGTAVTVHLELPNGPPDEKNQALLKQVAQSLRMVSDRDG